jgi:hypothetical protein
VRARNGDVADALDRVADLLQVQGADPYRVRAYRRAAQSCRDVSRPLTEVLDEEGEAGLVRLPAIGKSIASSIAEVLRSGRLGLLDRLESEVGPEELFTTLPGIGGELARRIHEELRIETLEDLELAAHDGRLTRVSGIGPRRSRAVRDELSVLLRRSSRRRALSLRRRRRARPSVALILELDEDYRREAAAGRLRSVAPRRFNPAGEAWLPVLDTEREGWNLTVLYSNSARAHRLGMTHDWVVVIFERDAEEGQCTVVTEHAGPLAGRRVVRGREAECLRLLGAQAG